MKIKPRILITSAGAGTALSFIRALNQDYFDLYAVGSNPYLPGLYLVKESFITADPKQEPEKYLQEIQDIVKEHKIDIIAPMHDDVLETLAPHRNDLGCELLLASDFTLDLCLDKWKLYQHLEDRVPQPYTISCESGLKVDQYPAITKPRSGSASEGFYILNSEDDLHLAAPENIIQQYLPGKEYSVDVYAARDGRVLAAVVRERLRSEFGLAQAAKSILDPVLAAMASEVARLIKLTGIANIQFREDESGNPLLLEVNPRTPGLMELTVESGANMPLMWVCETMGIEMPKVTFKEVAMIRQRTPVVVPVDQLHPES